MYTFILPAVMLIIIAAFTATAKRIFRELFLDDHTEISSGGSANSI